MKIKNYTTVIKIRFRIQRVFARQTCSIYVYQLQQSARRVEQKDSAILFGAGKSAIFIMLAKIMLHHKS